MAQDILIPKNFGVPATLGGDVDDDNLGAGLRPSFSVLAFPGGKWTTRYKKVETRLVDSNTELPIQQLEIVVIKTSEVLSRKYYPKWDPNSKNPPECWSHDGKTPDRTVIKPISPICATCEKGKIGSRITDEGKPAKQCGDFRRVAIVPLVDLENEALGGPMLLQIPAASLQGYAEFGDTVKQMGFKTFTIATRIRFDTDVNYPKIIFNPYRALRNEEVARILEWRQDPHTLRVLNEPDFAEEEGVNIPTADRTNETAAPPPPPPPQPRAATPPPPPPQPAAQPTQAMKKPAMVGGFGVSGSGAASPPQTVKAAVASPAPRPASVRPVQTGGFGAAPTAAAPPPPPPPPAEEEVVEEEGEPMNVGITAAMDDELDQLLASRK